jgi:hypothetical protein
MATNQTGLDKPAKVFLTIAVIGICLTVVVAILDGEGLGSLLQPSFFILVGLVCLILLEWISKALPLKTKWIPDALHTLFIWALMAAILKDSWPKVIHFLTHQRWLLLTLETLALVLLTYFYFVLRAGYPIVCAFIEIAIGIFLCASAIRGMAQERGLKTLAELLGAILVLVATFDNLQKVIDSNRNNKNPPPVLGS